MPEAKADVGRRVEGFGSAEGSRGLYDLALNQWKEGRLEVVDVMAVDDEANGFSALVLFSKGEVRGAEKRKEEKGEPSGIDERRKLD